MRENDLPPKPDPQTGEPRPPHAPLEPDWKRPEDKHENGESKVPQSPEREGPILEWFYPTLGRGGAFIGIALVIFVGFLKSFIKTPECYAVFWSAATRRA